MMTTYDNDDDDDMDNNDDDSDDDDDDGRIRYTNEMIQSTYLFLARFISFLDR